MRAANRYPWIFVVGVAGLGGCAQFGSSMNLATVLTGAPAKTEVAQPISKKTSVDDQPRLLPPVETVTPPPHETAKPPSWGLLDMLAPARRSAAAHDDAAPPPPSEFSTVAGLQLSPAAVPSKDEFLPKLKARPDVDADEYARWEKIVRETPDDDWPVVAIQLQAVLNYKSHQAAQRQHAESAGNAATSAEAAAAAPAPPHPPAALAPNAPEPAAASASAAPPPAEARADDAQPDVLPPPAADDPPQPLVGASHGAGDAEAATHARQHWREHLDRAIEALEAELAQADAESPSHAGNASPPESDLERRTQTQRQRERAHKEAYLRLLYVAAQRPADAARGVESFPVAEQEFWKHQVHGLGVFLDERGAPVADRRARLALRELQTGLHYLAAASGLDVRNLAFCPQVFSFGNYVEFSPYDFRPGQEVLLYAEIDNFAVESRPDGFETELQGSYQIFDAAGRRVAEHVFPAEKELCRNRRRDYFVPYRLYLPTRIAPGPYTLQLTVEDLKGRKFGQASIRFAIVP